MISCSVQTTLCQPGRKFVWTNKNCGCKIHSGSSSSECHSASLPLAGLRLQERTVLPPNPPTSKNNQWRPVPSPHSKSALLNLSAGAQGVAPQPAHPRVLRAAGRPAGLCARRQQVHAHLCGRYPLRCAPFSCMNLAVHGSLGCCGDAGNKCGSSACGGHPPRRAASLFSARRLF